jgi:hypothetical protein
MRSRLARFATASIMSIAVVVPSGARPAQAAIEWTSVITAAISAVSSWASAGSTQDAIKEATRQILAAVNSARSDILASIETIAVAETRACAHHAVIEFVDIELMTPDNMQRFAQDATGCAVLIDSVLNLVAPIALVARARTGLTTGSLQNTLRTANKALIPKLDVAGCNLWSPDFDPELPLPRPGAIVSYYITCWAYNNDIGSAYAEVVYPNQVPDSAFVPAVNEATRNTSRAIATAVVPLLGG